jgi:putative CRISPR-associated protein (TIGR02619 family)
LKVDPTQRLCGAEINSVEELIRKRLLTLEHLVFFVSDTDKGRNTGAVLKQYFEQRNDLGLRKVEFAPIHELQDERPIDFKVHGLRNLAREIGRYVQSAGGSDFIAIDATGGYKAQIAIAVIAGQALNIPVYYKHELFAETIDFPPLPISFDYQILGQNADLLHDFEQGKDLTSSQMEAVDEKMRVLLVEVNVDGETMYALSPIGQIYMTGFRVRNPVSIKLVNALNRKPPTFRDDHYPKGFKEFVEKVWNEHRWIVTANSLPYDGQRGIHGIGFKVRQEDGGLRLIGTFQDKDNFGGKFRLHLTDESEAALTWAAVHLNSKYRE